MNNCLKVDDVFIYRDSDYIALDKEILDNQAYFFTNKLINEDNPGKEFYIFKVIDDSAIIETNKEILDKLFKVFSERFNQKLKTISDNN